MENFKKIIVVGGLIYKKSQMLAWVSHDLRTPITRMKLQLALSKNPDPQDLKQDLKQMEAIINDYLHFVKGNNQPVVQRINLSKLLLSLIKTASTGSSAKIYSEIKSDIFAEVNENQIKRALFNLIDNAKRFAKKIKISLMQEEKDILIFIDDDGIGLSEAEMKQVFKPFYQTTKSVSNHPKGAGLGMPIVQNIITSHGGSIWLSKSPEGGLRVKIALKL